MTQRRNTVAFDVPLRAIQVRNDTGLHLRLTYSYEGDEFVCALTLPRPEVVEPEDQIRPALEVVEGDSQEDVNPALQRILAQESTTPARCCRECRCEPCEGCQQVAELSACRKCGVTYCSECWTVGAARVCGGCLDDEEEEEDELEPGEVQVLNGGRRRHDA